MSKKGALAILFFAVLLITVQTAESARHTTRTSITSKDLTTNGPVSSSNLVFSNIDSNKLRPKYLDNIRPEYNILLPPGNCRDSDRGRNPTVKGYATYFPDSADCASAFEEYNMFCREFPQWCSINRLPYECRPQGGADYCISSSVLKEYYCGSRGLRFEYITCELGCANGACRY